METPLLILRTVALASAVAWAGIVPAAAAPAFVSYVPTVRSDVVEVDSATIIRRERWHRDNHGDKRHRRDDRARWRGHDDGPGSFRPKATPKYAYDADGNFRVYDGDGWDGKGRRKNWDRRKDRDRWNDWDHKKRPRHYKLHSFGFQGPAPSPALRDILTTVPD